jgi:PST family polysaccharide transporter
MLGKKSHLAIQGGSYIAAQQILSILVSFVSVTMLARFLSHSQLANYVICSALWKVLGTLSRMGINARLLSQPERPSDRDFDVGLTTMILVSLPVSVSAMVVVPLVGRYAKLSGLFWPSLVTILLVPLAIVATTGSTYLERALEFKRVVKIDFIMQMISHAVGIVLAYLGFGVWGPILGWTVRALLHPIPLWAAIGRWPRLRWNPEYSCRLVKFGFGYSTASAFIQMRNLVVLFLVGKLADPTTVGTVGLTLRAVEVMTPFRTATTRVLFPTVSSILDSPKQLSRWLTSLVETETMASALVLSLSVAGYSLGIHRLFGGAWHNTLALYPWVAATSLLCTVHAPSLSILLIRGKFWYAILFTFLGYVAISIVFYLVRQFHTAEAYAVGMLIFWPASWLSERFSARRFGTKVSINGVIWAISGACCCIAWRQGYIILFVPIAALIYTHGSIVARIKAIANGLLSKPCASEVV